MREIDNTSICMKNGIAVYPVGVKGGRKSDWQIEYSEFGVVKQRFKKILTTSKQVNDAMRKTYKFLADEILNQKL